MGTEDSGPHVPFAGLVDLGFGRKLYLECQGNGSPTVVLISGLDAAADVWTGYQAHRASHHGPSPEQLTQYPAMERSNFDESLAQTRAVPPLRGSLPVEVVSRERHGRPFQGASHSPRSVQVETVSHRVGLDNLYGFFVRLWANKRVRYIET